MRAFGLALKWFWRLFGFCVLTTLTQIGGLVLVASLLLQTWIDRKHKLNHPRTAGIILFLISYGLATGLIVPLLAPAFGRRPLPMGAEKGLMPRTIWTVVLNRHYVSTELYSVLRDVERGTLSSYPGSTILYLDACFPFWDGFPLLPHLSHNDGDKVDIAFRYRRSDGTTEFWSTPTLIGYGSFADRFRGERDTHAECAARGSWWYSRLGLLPKNRDLRLDEARTKELVERFVSDPRINKVFVEPFLATRWGLYNSKIRFHGCHAVSHADHIHVQL